MSDSEACCPQCHAAWPFFIPSHVATETKDKGKVQAVCFQCGYAGSAYILKADGRSVIIMHGKDKPVKEPEKVITKDERLTFKAVKGDMELTLSCSRDGLQKLLSMFMEG